MKEMTMMLMMTDTCANNDGDDGRGADSAGDIDDDEGEVDKNR